MGLFNALEQAKNYQSNSGISPLKANFSKFEQIQKEEKEDNEDLTSISSSKRGLACEVFNIARPSTSGSGIGDPQPFKLTLRGTFSPSKPEDSPVL